MRFNILAVLASLTLLAACNPESPEQPTTTSNPSVIYGETLKEPGMTRVAVHSSITHAQPMAGLVLFADNAREHPEYNDAISLEFSYILPCRCVTGKENEEIQYNWPYVDSILDDIASRNHQAVLRVRYVLPGSLDVDSAVPGATAVPQYIKDDEDEYHESFNQNDDGPTWYPDWDSSELKWFTKRFFTDFAERYNYDPRIAFMEVGFGHWAEYHIYGTELMFGTNFPTHEYQAEFLEHLSQVLEIPWSISIDAADDTYTPIAGNPELLALPFGLFDDSFMHRDHEGDYNEECWNSLRYTTRWQRAPMGGEISYYSHRDQRNFLNPNGLYGHTWAEQAAKYHISFMFANDAMDGSYGTPQHYLDGSLQAGYRFKVLDVMTNEDSTAVLVTNTGVAPIYREVNFSIGQISGNDSLQTLMPGDTTIVIFYASLLNGKQLEMYSPFVLDDQVIQFEADVNP